MHCPAKALPTALALLSMAGLAHAQGPAVAATTSTETASPSTPSADALFREGTTLLKAGQVDAACGKLAQSQSVEPAIGTLGLLAYCHEQLGKLATAIREYSEVAELSHLAAQAEREKVARERVAELSQHVTRLAVVLSEPAADVEVYLDARRLGEGELGSLPVDPGTVQLRITGLDREPFSQPLRIPADGSTVRVVVPRLVRHEAPVAVVPKKAAPPPPPRSDRGLTRPAVWASFGASAVSIAIGSYFGLSAIAARSDSKPHCVGNTCDQTGVDAREHALDRARVSTIAFAVGAVGAATGAVLLWTEGSQQPHQQAALSMRPGGATLTWEKRF